MSSFYTTFREGSTKYGESKVVSNPQMKELNNKRCLSSTLITHYVRKTVKELLQGCENKTPFGGKGLLNYLDRPALEMWKLE